jgi:hypothetical protein
MELPLILLTPRRTTKPSDAITNGSSQKVSLFSEVRLSLFAFMVTLCQAHSAYAAPPNFSQLAESHIAHQNAIVTGEITLVRTVQTFMTEEELERRRAEMRQDTDRIVEGIASSSRLSQAQKAERIEALRHRRELHINDEVGRAERTLQHRLSYTFDNSVRSYCVEQTPLHEIVSDPKLGPISSDHQRRVVITSNGNQVRYYPDGVEVPSAVVTQFESENPNDLPSGLGILHSSWLERRTVQPEIRQEKLEGTDLFVYEFPDEEGDGYWRVDVDPALGYRFRRMQQWKGDFLRREIVASNYDMVDGIPFPKTFTDVFYRKDEAFPIVRQETLEVEEASFNIDIKQGQFSPSFPPGTIVTDDSLGVMYEVGRSDIKLESVDDLIDMGMKKRLDLALKDKVPQSASSEPSSSSKLDGRPANSNRTVEERTEGYLSVLACGCVVVGLAVAFILVTSRKKKRAMSLSGEESD